MRSLFLLPLLLYAYKCMTLTELNCPLYACEPKLKGCAIISFSGQQMRAQLQECADNEICDMNFTNNAITQCSAHYQVTKMQAGEYCRTSEECQSGFCEASSSTCRGYIHDSYCYSDMECALGLFCSNGKCTYAKNKGEYCDETTKCQSNYVCNAKNCTLIGSIPNGKEATISAACQSLYLENGMCTLGPILNKEDRNKKNIEVCHYTVQGRSFTLPPVCGIASERSVYCNLGLGDVDLSSYARYIQSDTITAKCSIARGPLCQYKRFEEMGQDYYKAYVTYMEAITWASFVDNEDCVKKTINKVYWDSRKKLTEHEENSIAMVIMIVIIVAVAIVVIIVPIIKYLGRQKPEVEETTEDTLFIN